MIGNFFTWLTYQLESDTARLKREGEERRRRQMIAFATAKRRSHERTAHRPDLAPGNCCCIPCLEAQLAEHAPHLLEGEAA